MSYEVGYLCADEADVALYVVVRRSNRFLGRGVSPNRCGTWFSPSVNGSIDLSGQSDWWVHPRRPAQKMYFSWRVITIEFARTFLIIAIILFPVERICMASM